MGTIEFITQLLSQLGITLVGVLAGVWAAVTLVSKQWLELEFGKRKEEHKQEVENYYRQHQESFKQEIDNYYKVKQEAFKQALTTGYSKELETHKAEHQQQIERMKGNIAEELEGTKAGHQLNLEKQSSISMHENSCLPLK
jgi:ABC-type transport system involved in cytochrome bd biosynthesis fused ATPase/permease subunit